MHGLVVSPTVSKRLGTCAQRALPRGSAPSKIRWRQLNAGGHFRRGLLWSMAILCAPPPLSAAADVESPPPVDGGLAVFEHEKCGRCHRLAALGQPPSPPPPSIPGVEPPPQPPDLTGALLRLEADSIGPWIRRKARRRGRLHPVRFRGSDGDLAALLTWLASLEPAPEPADSSPASSVPAPASAEK